MVLSFVFEGPAAVVMAVRDFTWTGAGSVFYLSYLSTVLAYSIWSWLISRHSLATVVPFSLLVPVFGVLGGVLILGEIISQREAVGSFLISWR